MKGYTSDFIFKLVDKYNISLGDAPAIFLDEDYINFCDEYVKQSKIRDQYLKEHLKNHPSLFRTFLPWRQYIFGTVFQLQWYYDEIIIYDPIFFEISHFKSGSTEYDKQKLLVVLKFLNNLKDSIKEGFLLFGCYDSFPTNEESNNQANVMYKKIVDIPEIREECDKLPIFYKMDTDDGKLKSYFQVRGMYRNIETVFSVYEDVEKLKEGDGYSIIFNFASSNYSPLSLDDIKAGGFYDRAFKTFSESYPLEIKEIMHYIDIGTNIQTPILFNRDLDKLVLSTLEKEDNKINTRPNDYYKLFLPFVDGVPPERLMDLRMNMPNAFRDFRDTMFEIIYDYERTYTEREILELKIKQKVNPIIDKLDGEIKKTLTKVKITGVGSALVSGIGSLGLWHFGIDMSKYLGLLVGGSIIHQSNVISNYINEKRDIRHSPMYYLWKAQQDR